MTPSTTTVYPLELDEALSRAEYPEGSRAFRFVTENTGGGITTRIVHVLIAPPALAEVMISTWQATGMWGGAPVRPGGN